MKSFIVILCLASFFLCQPANAQVSYPCGSYYTYFNGTSDYGYWDRAYNSPDFTLAAWVRIVDSSALGTRMAILSRNENSYESVDYGIFINESGNIIFRTGIVDPVVAGMQFDSLSSGVKMQLNRWYHVAFTLTGLKQCSFYIDGKLAAAKSLGGNLAYINTGSAYSHAIGVGVRPPYNSFAGFTNYFKGNLDEVVYASKALSASLIDSLARGITAGSPFLTTNQVSLYAKFDNAPYQNANSGIAGGTLPYVASRFACSANKSPVVFTKCPGSKVDISGLIRRSDYLNVFWLTSDGSTAIDPSGVDTGSYVVKTTTNNTIFETTMIQVKNNPKPDLGPDKEQVYCPITYANDAHLFDSAFSKNSGFSLVGWYTLSGIPVDPTLVPFDIVRIVVKNEFACYDTATVFPVAFPVRNILPAAPREAIATSFKPDTDGWVNYYYDYIDNMGNSGKYLLLSLQVPAGTDIGSFGDGTFQVKVGATSGAGSGNALKLTSPTVPFADFYVMNRFWQVTPTHEPDKPVGVRFYYNSQDFNDLKTSLPYLTDVNSPIQHGTLIFYKTTGGSPDPSTNLAGLTNFTQLKNGAVASPSTWVYKALECGEFLAEFQVTSFSGGGGGGRANPQILPLQLVSFTGTSVENKTILSWTTSDEINTKSFEIESSSDGLGYSKIGVVNALGHSAATHNYSYADNLFTGNTTYYRLKMWDKDELYTYSNIVVVKGNTKTATLAIFPNPGRNILHVRSSDLKGNVGVQIIDITGRIMKIQKIYIDGTNSFSIDIRELPAGFYELQVNNNRVNMRQKFVKE